MRILLVTQYFWPENFGINRQVIDLVDRGIEVTVLTGKPNYPSGKIHDGYNFWGIKREEYKGVKIIRIPLIPRGKSSSFRLIINYISFVLFGLIYGSFVFRKYIFDAVFVYAPSPVLQAIPAIVIAKIKRIPVALWVQDLWPHSLEDTGYIKNRTFIWIVDIIVRFIYKNINLLLVQSKAFIEVIKLQARSSTKITYFPNSADINSINNYEILDFESKKWVDQIKKSFSVVFTGNIGAAQSIQTIVQAAELCKDEKGINFFIIGSGSMSEWLSLEIQRLELKNIFYTGWLPSASMGMIWKASSVLLVSLLDRSTFNQTIPNKLQCYLASGRPIIGSLAGEAARTIEISGAGIVCDPENALLLANAVKRMFAMSSEDRDNLGNSGQQYFNQNFDPKILTTNLIKILSELVCDYKK